MLLAGCSRAGDILATAIASVLAGLPDAAHSLLECESIQRIDREVHEQFDPGFQFGERLAKGRTLLRIAFPCSRICDGSLVRSSSSIASGCTLPFGKLPALKPRNRPRPQ